MFKRRLAHSTKTLFKFGVVLFCIPSCTYFESPISKKLKKLGLKHGRVKKEESTEDTYNVDGAQVSFENFSFSSESLDVQIISHKEDKYKIEKIRFVGVKILWAKVPINISYVDVKFNAYNSEETLLDIEDISFGEVGLDLKEGMVPNIFEPNLSLIRDDIKALLELPKLFNKDSVRIRNFFFETAQNKKGKSLRVKLRMLDTILSEESFSMGSVRFKLYSEDWSNVSTEIQERENKVSGATAGRGEFSGFVSSKTTVSLSTGQIGEDWLNLELEDLEFNKFKGFTKVSVLRKSGIGSAYPHSPFNRFISFSGELSSKKDEGRKLKFSFSYPFALSLEMDEEKSAVSLQYSAGNGFPTKEMNFFKDFTGEEVFPAELNLVSSSKKGLLAFDSLDGQLSLNKLVSFFKINIERIVLLNIHGLSFTQHKIGKSSVLLKERNSYNLNVKNKFYVKFPVELSKALKSLKVDKSLDVYYSGENWSSVLDYYDSSFCKYQNKSYIAKCSTQTPEPKIVSVLKKRAKFHTIK